MPVICSGNLHGIVAWFELQLDDEIMLSSSPHSRSCWEQAVYHIQEEGSEPLSEVSVSKGIALKNFYNLE